MSDVEPDDPRLKGRPLWGLAILALPVVGVTLTFVAYAVLVSLGLKGRPASGAPLELRFEACAEAKDVVAARLGDMGYPASSEPLPGGFLVRFVGPDDPALAAALPQTLATPGLFELRGEDLLLATQDDVEDASVRLDVLMTATTLIHLRDQASDRVKAHVRAHPGGRLDFYVDGARVGGQSNSTVVVGEVEIAPPLDDDADRLRATAGWGVVIDHPLPCAVREVAPPNP